ncbi:MAG: CPBP family intramembrane glutamic endopeptidase [Armatimonadota bacterium]
MMDWQKIWIDTNTGRLRCGWRVLAFVALVLPIWSLLSSFLWEFIKGTTVNVTGQGYWQALAEFIAAILVFTIAGLWAVRTMDRLPEYSLGLTTQGAWLRSALSGLCLGLGLAAVLVFVLWVTGIVQITWHAWDHREGTALATALVVSLALAVAEGIMFRGYLFQTLLRGIGPLAALIICSGLFTLYHAYTDPHQVTPLGATNVFLIGVALSMLYLRLGSLWLPIGLQAGWTFGLLICHLHVSSLALPATSSFTTLVSGYTWAGGGTEFGPEGSVVTSVLFLAVTAVATLSRYGIPLASYWWEWRELISMPQLPASWDLTIGSRHYQWKLLVRDSQE